MLNTSRFRTITTLAFTALVMSGCAETTALPTTLDPVEMQADVEAANAAFDTPATNSFSEMGYAMDNALVSVGGFAMALPMAALRDGPTTPLMESRDRIISMLDDPSTMASAIPLSALGKTFVWNVTTDQYEVSARTGAPANGVRFVLYVYDYATFSFAEPLVEVGYAQFSRTLNTATVSVFLSNNTKVVEYTATLGGSALFPTFSIAGFAGSGANLTNFNLALGVSATTQNLTTTWRTEMPSRGLSSRVALSLGETSGTIGAVMRRGVRKVEMAGSFNDLGGTLNVKVGDKLFARLTFSDLGVTVTDADGAPLSEGDETTLRQIFDWFENAFEAPNVLIGPLYTLLDFAGI